MAAKAREPITCHVLDTHAGKPAPGIVVSLHIRAWQARAASAALISYVGTTNQDGRVTSWSVDSEGKTSTLESVFRTIAEDFSCSLVFHVSEYWKEKQADAFFDDVTISFKAGGYHEKEDHEKQHYHVPLLMGPYSYSTYRGS